MLRARLACLQLFVVLAVVFAVAGTARADGLAHIVVGPGGPTCVMPTPCMHTTDCSAPESCQTVPAATGSLGMFCLRDLTSEVFCCVSGSGTLDCPGGSSCARVGGGGGAVAGICADSRDFCVPPTSISDADLPRIASCFAPPPMTCVSPIPPRDSGPVPYAMGDCDADGIANGLEPGSICTFDAPMCRADAGVPSDASISPADSGPRGDGGGNADAGNADEDAGDVPVDAGSLSIDAGTIPPGVSFRGAGGCACNVAGGGARGGYAILALVLIALARRRR